MIDTRLYLKVKVKSLAAEAKIIRKEEKRCKNSFVRNGLYRHRIDVVRKEARATNLAYGFLKGIPYKKMENGAKDAPDWGKIAKMVEKYGKEIVQFLPTMTYKDYEQAVEIAKQQLVDKLKEFHEWWNQAVESKPE